MKRKTIPYEGEKMKKIGILVLMVFVSGTTLLLGADNEYGSMYDTSTTAATVGTAWAEIGDYEGSTVSSSNVVFSDANDYMTISTAGTYLIRYSVSFMGAAITWQTAVAIGDGTATTDTKYGIMDRHIGNSADVGNASGTALVSVSSGDKVYLVAKASAASSSFTIKYAQVTIVKTDQLDSPYYADVSMVDQTTALSAVDTWYPISGFSTSNSDFTGSTTDGWNLETSTYLKAYGSNVAGDYLAIVSVSFSGIDDGIYSFALTKSTNSPLDGTQLSRVINFKNSLDIGNAVSCGIITIAEDDQLHLISRVENDKTGDMKGERGNITLIKLDGASTAAPYAEMHLTGNTENYTAISSAGWSKVTYFGIPETGYVSLLKDWQFINPDVNSNYLHPINDTAGKYLMSYSATATLEGTETASAQFTSLFTLLVNGSEKADITMERFLEKKSAGDYDYGSVSGSSIISIEAVNDNVEFALKTDESTAYNLEMKECNVTLHRIWTDGDGALPVTLSNFSAAYIGSVPIIAWTTQSESGNAGWNIYRGDSPEALQNGDAFLVNGSLIDGAGTTSEPTNYTFTDEYVYSTNTSYYYWLESVSISGVTENHGPVQLYIPNNNPGSPAVPTAFGLYQNYPNPFNPTTAISFSVPSTTRATLTIYNQTGAKVTTLFQGIVPAKEVQTLTWDGTDSFGKEVASGIYLYKLQTEKDTFTRRMMLIK